MKNWNVKSTMIEGSNIKYYITYLQPGEFGNNALWGVFCNKYNKNHAGNWVAFYNTYEDAKRAYPEATAT